ncbi:MAG: diguanylate cyclase [Baekduia sp.]
MTDRADTESVTGLLIADGSDPALPIVFASSGFELVTGYSAAEVHGQNPRFLQGPDTDPRAVATIRQAIGEGREAATTVLNYRADGTPFWNELTIAPERTERGEIVRWVAVMRDVTDRMQQAARLHELSYFDRLTGLANREALHDALRSALHRARVHDRECALMVIDLEEFGHVNRGHGREVGDVVLREAADRLQSLVRPNDTLARTDGDEFTLLLTDVPDNAGEVALELSQRLLAALREPFGADGLKIELRANVGIGVFPGAMTTQELVDHAQRAVDIARDSGRPVHLFEPRPARMLVVADEAFDPRSYFDELGDVLAGGTITCELEPVVRLSDGSIAGYEALARGPEGSALHTPMRLRACAEAAGRLEQLDWACRRAAVAAAESAGLPDGTTLYVNVTTATLGDLPDAGEAGDRFDIVLDVAIDDVEAGAADAVRGAARWQARGGRIAVDDVGAGTHALGLLPLMSPDVVKLDLTRIHKHAPSERARLAAAVAALGDRTGAQVMVEAIESDADLVTAQALGAKLGSGRLFKDAAGKTGPSRRSVVPPSPASDPFAAITAVSPARAVAPPVAAEAMALAELRAQHGDGVVVLSVISDPELLDGERCARLRAIARNSPLVALFGDNLGSEPVAGATGVQLSGDDDLRGRWSLVVLGADVALAVAVEEDGPDSCRLAQTTDPSAVVAAARSLLPRL